MNLYDYKVSKTISNPVYYGFGACEAASPKIFYIPTSAGIASISGASYNSNKPAGQASSFDGGCGSWTKDSSTVTINGVIYDKWVNSGKFGAQNIKINFA